MTKDISEQQLQESIVYRNEITDADGNHAVETYTVTRYYENIGDYFDVTKEAADEQDLDLSTSVSLVFDAIDAVAAALPEPVRADFQTACESFLSVLDSYEYLFSTPQGN